MNCLFLEFFIEYFQTETMENESADKVGYHSPLLCLRYDTVLFVTKANSLFSEFNYISLILSKSFVAIFK